MDISVEHKGTVKCPIQSKVSARARTDISQMCVSHAFCSQFPYEISLSPTLALLLKHRYAFDSGCNLSKDLFNKFLDVAERNVNIWVGDGRSNTLLSSLGFLLGMMKIEGRDQPRIRD